MVYWNAFNILLPKKEGSSEEEKGSPDSKGTSMVCLNPGHRFPTQRQESSQQPRYWRVMSIVCRFCPQGSSSQILSDHNSGRDRISQTSWLRIFLCVLHNASYIVCAYDSIIIIFTEYYQGSEQSNHHRKQEGLPFCLDLWNCRPSMEVAGL